MSTEHDVVEQLLNEVEFLRATVTRLVGALGRGGTSVDELPGYAKGYADGLSRRPMGANVVRLDRS